jgi:hypothetical protein
MKKIAIKSDTMDIDVRLKIESRRVPHERSSFSGEGQESWQKIRLRRCNDEK